MTQRVRDGLGLPAGLYRLVATGTNPTFYAPNGLTSDGVASLVYANVIPVTGGYDFVLYDGEYGVFKPSESLNPSFASYNNEAMAVAGDILREIFQIAHPGEESPYRLETSSTRTNIVGDLATLKADFVLNPPE